MNLRFTVRRAGLRLAVQIVPTVRDVQREYRERARPFKGAPARGDFSAFFAANLSNSNGAVVLPLNCTPGLVAHEVNHAVLNVLRRHHHGPHDARYDGDPLALCDDGEEWLCQQTQHLTDAIWRRVERARIERRAA